MYKWQDESGVWHFSSVPPKSEQTFEVMEMPADPAPVVSMRQLGSEREPEFSFINNTWGPIELELALADAENVVSEPPLPARFVLPAQSERRLVKVMGANPAQGFSFRLSYRHMVGPPLASLPMEVDYYPPFPLGMRFWVSQGFDGDVTHQDPSSQYAVDIAMPEGTPVLAARAGRVIQMEDDFHGGAQRERYLTRSNHVRILHEDGTMALYAHLQANSLRIREGAEVSRGQWIANSGNTGYSSGPHLHLAIQLNTGLALESLPFRFVTPTGSTVTPAGRVEVEGVLPND